MNKTSVRVSCPYCGKLQSLLLPLEPGVCPKTIHRCDVEVGGCDKEFVVGIKWSSVTDSYKLDKASYG